MTCPLRALLVRRGGPRPGGAAPGAGGGRHAPGGGAPPRGACEGRTADRGTGLGLSIVAAIAGAHGGTLDLCARPEGGLHVAIRLPLLPPPQEVEET